MTELPSHLTVKEAARIAGIAYTTMIFHVRTVAELGAVKEGKSYKIPAENFAVWLMSRQSS